MNRLPDISLCDYISPLDLSTGVPVESGVRRPFVTHHSMEVAAHPFPAPRSVLPEAEQLLTECFLSHTYIYIYMKTSREVALRYRPHRSVLGAYRVQKVRLISALFRSVQLWGIDENQQIHCFQEMPGFALVAVNWTCFWVISFAATQPRSGLLQAQTLFPPAQFPERKFFGHRDLRWHRCLGEESNLSTKLRQRAP